MAYVYIIKLIDGTHYCGITKNISARLLQHQRGESKSTKYKRPIVLKFLKETDSMANARYIEMRIKQQGVTRWLIKNVHRPDNIVTLAANSQQPLTSRG